MQFWQPTRGILQPNQHWRRGQGVVGGFSAEAQQFINRVTISGADQTRYATLIDAINASAGLWAKIGNLKVYKAPDAATSLINLKSSSYPTSNVSALPFTANAGYTTGAAGTQLLELRSTELTQNDASHFIWNTNATSTSTVLMRGTSATKDVFYTNYSDGRTYRNLNSTVDDSAGIVVSPAAGMHGCCRTNNTITYFQNAVNLGTRTDTSVTPEVSNYRVHEGNAPGTTWGYLNGAALTGAEVLVVYNAFGAF